MGELFEEAKGAGIVRFLILIACGFWLTACSTTGASLDVDRDARFVSGTMRPYQVGGRWYYPKEQPGYVEVGVASWYGAGHHGKATATGEIFDQWEITGAHKTLPLPCIVEVTNLDNGKTIRVRVNDRGPFVDGRIIDLSRAAAEKLGFDRKGLTRVRVRYLGPAGRD